MTDHYQSAGVHKGPARFVRTFIYSILLVAVLVFILPFTQHLLKVKEQRTVRTVDVALPPPPPPPPDPPPPPEEKVEQPSPELQSQPKPLSLSQLQLSMNPGTGNALGAAFGMGSFDVNTNALEEIQTFSMSELDQKPHVIRKPDWITPNHLRGRVKGSVKVIARYIIDQDGRVEFIRFEQITHPEAADAIREYIEKIRWSQPTKDGKPAKVNARFPLTLEI